MRRALGLSLLCTSCALLPRQTPLFPSEYVVHRLEIRDGGVLPGVDMSTEALVALVPGEIFDHYEWTRDQERLLAAYRARGFHRARFEEVDAVVEREGVRLLYVIDAGPPLIVGSVAMHGSWVVPASRLVYLLGLSPGMRMDRIALELGKGRIRAALAEEGYPHATATSRIEVRGDVAHLDVAIRDGPFTRVGDVSLVGVKTLRPWVAMRSVRLREGDVFRPKDVYETQRALLATGLFSSVRVVVPGMETGEDTLRVFVHVREARRRFVEAGCGYASPDRGALSWAAGHQNLWGVAARVRLSVGLEQGWVTRRRQASAGLTFQWPWVARLPADAGFGIDYRWREEPNARSEGFGASAEIGRTWRERASVSGRYRYRWRRVRIEGGDPSDYVMEESRRPIANSVGLVVTIDRRSSFADPTDGELLRLQLTHAGGALGGDWSFRKALGDLSIYRAFGHGVLAMRVSGGLIRPLRGSPTAPEEERFRAGGANTVRGFPEEGLGPLDPSGSPVGGEAMVLLSGELRRSVWGPLGVAGFVDCGQVWERVGDARVVDLEPTVGCGIRYATIIGPVRLDWGVPVRHRRIGRLYLTLGHAF